MQFKNKFEIPITLCVLCINVWVLQNLENTIDELLVEKMKYIEQILS